MGAAATTLRPTALLVPGAVNGDLTVAFDHQFNTGNWRACRHSPNEATPQTGRGVRQTIHAIS
jgi:hypothetical protein